MITDSDLNEGHNILINKVNALGDDAIKSGIPAVGGMVAIDITTDPNTHTNTYTPSLQKGDVYVDGIRGQFRERRKKGLRSLRGKLLALGADIETIRGRLKLLSEEQIATHLFQLSTGEATIAEIVDSLPPKEDNPTKDLAYYYHKQADFPSPPTLVGDTFLYVDLWQRPIFWLEDSDLVDPGWHGADTAFRSRTMVQVKTVSSRDELKTGRFPQKGNAQLASFLIPNKEEEDDCDPCAQELDIAARTGNKLVRLEVLDVIGDANQPTKVLLAWSDENASLAYPTDKDYPEGFDKAGAVYEFFSEVTESHLGVFDDETTRKRSHVVKGLPGITPAREDGKGTGDWPFVRRWNGYVWVKFEYESKDKIKKVAFGDTSHANALSQTEETIKIEFGNVLLSLHIHVGGNPKDFIAGDYWLTLVRENATGVERVNEITKRPMGITHHYLPLFEIGNEFKPKKLNDAGHRQLSFPPLTDLPADHVSYDDHCAEHFESIGGKVENVHEALDRMCKLKAEHIKYDDHCAEHFESIGGQVENVHGALDRLCKLKAEHISFTNECETDIFGEATTVQEALTALCDVNCCDEHNLYLHDWGAVCGLKVICTGTTANTVAILPGAMVDQTGHLSVLEDKEGFDVVTASENLDVDDGGNFSEEDGLVLAIEYNATVKTHNFKLFTKDQAKKEFFEESFIDKLQDCLAKYIKIFDTDGFSQSTKDTVPIILKFIPSKDTQSPVRFNIAAQYSNLSTFYDEAWKRLDFLTSCAARELRTVFPKLSVAKGNPMKVINAFIDLINAARTAGYDCACAAFIPDCPGEKTPWVPLCEIKLDPRTNSIREISNISCRKFCLTWRSFRYWLNPILEQGQAGLAKALCEAELLSHRASPDPTSPGGVSKPGIFKPGPNYMTINPEMLTGIEPGIKLSGFVGMPQVEALAAAEDAGLVVNESKDLKTLSVAKRRQFYKGDFTPGDIVLRNGTVTPGDIINFSIGEGKIIEAIPISPGIPEEAISKKDFGLFGIERARFDGATASADLAVTNVKFEEIAAENAALRNELEATRGEMAVIRTEMTGAMAKFRKNQPPAFVISDPAVAKVFIGAEAETIGKIAELTPQKKKAIREETGISVAEMNLIVRKAREMIRE